MSDISLNPLLLPFGGRHLYIPFEKIKLEHFMPAIDEGIRQARENIEHIKANTEAPNFKNTCEPFEVSSSLLDRVSSVFYCLNSAEAGPEHHALAQQVGPKMSAFSNDLAHDAKLFDRVRTVWKHREEFSLNKEQQKLLENQYRSFVRNGALLGETEKAQLRKIDEEMSRLAPIYSENVLKATNAVEWTFQSAEQLKGLPERDIQAAAARAKEKSLPEGSYLVNLQFPSLLPVLTYADDRSLREKVSKAFRARAFGGEFDNQSNLKRIAVLRFERARLLGYNDHAHYVLEERMAKDTSTVKSFLDKIYKKVISKGREELKELSDFAKSLGGPQSLEAWDVAYYSEKLKKEKYAFDDEMLRPYFSLDKCIEGIFEHAKRLYGLSFQVVNDVPVYHSDVRVYEVHDEDGSYVGTMYADFYPRETKKSGAWMMSFRDQGLRAGDRVHRPHVAICCNFPKPTAQSPALLSFNDVRTLFHEFGHALHGLLSNVTYTSLSGTNVFWDFVELPSQIMENWIQEKESLDLFAHHFETGAAIPVDLVAKLKRATNFQVATGALRQLNFGYLDMAWHSGDPRNVGDVAEFENKATEHTRLLPLTPGTNSSCSFGHIFSGGYSSGYYSYKWAEVLDADAFEFFKEKGLFNREVSLQFRKQVLEKGGSEHPMELYKKFRGREPDPDALLRRDGLL